MGSSYPGCDGDEGVYFPCVALYDVDEWVIFGVFMIKGLVENFVMVVCELYEMNCVRGEGGSWFLAMVLGSNYA